jgi:ABC-type sugar transport system substrate-binding protein/maltose-binding protein MalE
MTPISPTERRQKRLWSSVAGSFLLLVGLCLALGFHPVALAQSAGLLPVSDSPLDRPRYDAIDSPGSPQPNPLRIDVNYAGDWVHVSTEPNAAVTVTVAGKGTVHGQADASGSFRTPPSGWDSGPYVPELVIWWAQWDPANWLQEIGNLYEQETGIKVTVVQHSWGSFWNSVANEWATHGTGYDMLVGDSQWIGQAVKEGHFADMTDFLTATGVKDTVTAASLKYYGEYPPGSGHYYAYPTEGDAIGWAYRKDIVESAAEKAAFEAKNGYKYSVPPKDYNEFVDMAEFFHRPAAVPPMYGAAVYSEKNYDAITVGFQNALFTYGCDWHGAGWVVQGVLNAPHCAESLEAYRALYNSGPPGNTHGYFSQMNNYFITGQAAFAMNFFSFLPALANPSTDPNYYDKVGFFANPPGPYGQQGASMGGQGAGINAYTGNDRRQASYNFIRWFAQDRIQAKWAELGGYSSNKNVLASEAFLQAKPWNPALAESMAIVKDFYNIPEYDQLLAPAQLALNNYVVGSQGTAQATMDSIAAQHTQILTNLGYIHPGPSAGPAGSRPAAPTIVQPDIQPGDQVTVEAAGSAATVNLVGTISGAANAGSDTVAGTIRAAFSEPLRVRCEVWVDEGPDGIETTADPDGGSYSCDFGAAGWDLRSGQEVAVRYFEPDGDSVINIFQTPWRAFLPLVLRTQPVDMLLLPKFMGLDLFDQANEGAQEAHQELHNTGRLTYTGPTAQNSAAGQIEIVTNAPSQGYKAIMISNNAGDQIVPAVQAARAQGLTVVTWDSPIPSALGEQVYVAPVDFGETGRTMAEMARDILGPGGGKFAVLSSFEGATQDAWIADLQEVLQDPEYANLELIDIVYGNDQFQYSYNLALALVSEHPDMKLIMAPTTVGIRAAAKAMQDGGYCDTVKVSGLGLPSEMAQYTLNGCAPEFALWSFVDLGYLTYYVTYRIATGSLQPVEGATFQAGRMGAYTTTKDPNRDAGLRVLMGPFTKYTADNLP